MITIKKFNEINIIPNSLVVFDIDETLIKFEGIDFKWWKNKFNKYYKMVRDYNIAEELANEEWIKIINRSDPELVDDYIHKFIEQLEENDCHTILLTARNNVLRDLTLEHLSKVNLYFENVYFNGEKGDELKKIVESTYPNIQNIIVIDDREQNLEDIKNKFNGTNYKLNLYAIKT